MSAPVTRAGRHARIVELIRSRTVRSQTELADLLAHEGVQVTQAAGAVHESLPVVQHAEDRARRGTGGDDRVQIAHHW